MEHCCLQECFRVPDVGLAGNDSTKVFKISFGKLEFSHEYFQINLGNRSNFHLPDAHNEKDENEEDKGHGASTLSLESHVQPKSVKLS